MSFKLKESVGVCAIALLNGYFVYPKVKHIYRSYNSLKLLEGDPTHFVSANIRLEISGLHGLGSRRKRYRTNRF